MIGVLWAGFLLAWLLVELYEAAGRKVDRAVAEALGERGVR